MFGSSGSSDGPADTVPVPLASSPDSRQGPTLPEYTDQLQILDAVADGITAQDPSGSLFYANQAAARAIGVPSVEALLEMSPVEIMAAFELIDEHEAPLPVASLPGRLALQGMEAPERLVGFRNNLSGELRWSMVKARPVYDTDGTVRFAVNIFRDVTESRRAEAERARLLADAETARAEAVESAENLWAIDRVTDAALSHLPTDELLNELLERVEEFVGGQV